MNLYFRLLKILLLYCCGFLKRTKTPTEVFKLSFRAWPHDLDFNFHMNNGRYLTIMDLGRLDFMLRLGIAGAILKNFWMPMVGTAFVRFRKPVGAFTRFEMHTRIAAWDEKWFYIEHAFVQRGEVAAIAYIKGLIHGRTEPIPVARLFGIAGISAVSPPVPSVFLKMDEAHEASRAALQKQ